MVNLSSQPAITPGCFLDTGRPCDQNCSAFLANANPPESERWRNCLILSSLSSMTQQVTQLSRYIRDSSADAQRKQEPPTVKL